MSITMKENRDVDVAEAVEGDLPGYLLHWAGLK